MTYPDCEDDESGYTAGLIYEQYYTVFFPGKYERYKNAAEKARKMCAAALGAGEVGCKPCVSYIGNRPAGFPKNGVCL